MRIHIFKPPRARALIVGLLAFGLSAAATLGAIVTSSNWCQENVPVRYTYGNALNPTFRAQVDAAAMVWSSIVGSAFRIGTGSAPGVSAPVPWTVC